MHATREKEHAWLERFVGEWTFESEVSMGPDQPPMKSRGREKVTSLGGVWILCDGVGLMPDDSEGRMQMTLGFDGKKRRFVGSFVGSMMTHFWVYDGALDESGTRLVLDTVGPACMSDELIPYQDILEMTADGKRTLTSRMKGPDGAWATFMTAHYTRVR